MSVTEEEKKLCQDLTWAKSVLLRMDSLQRVVGRNSPDLPLLQTGLVLDTILRDDAGCFVSASGFIVFDPEIGAQAKKDLNWRLKWEEKWELLPEGMRGTLRASRLRTQRFDWTTLNGMKRAEGVWVRARDEVKVGVKEDPFLTRADQAYKSFLFPSFSRANVSSLLVAV